MKEKMKSIMHDKKKIAQLLLLVVSTVILMGTVTFAYFSAMANNDKAATIDGTTAFLKLRFADGDNGINGTIAVGETVTKKFLIENTGTAEASLSIDWVDMINTYMINSLSYRLTYSETEDGEYHELLPYSNIPVSSEPLKQTLAGEVSVPAGETYYYNLDITYNDLPDVDQSPDIGATFTTVFDTGQPIKYRYYTLSVDPNGGTWNGYSEAYDYHLKNGETLEIAEIPTKIGATFGGWKVEGISSTLEDDVFTMGIGDTRIVAQWDMIEYGLTIDLDNGIYDGDLPTKIEYGSSIELKTPTREGYTFAGWEVSAGSINENTFTLDSASDAAITAKWTANSYNYKVIHRLMNVSGSGYTEVDSETGSLEYGKTLTPAVKTYDGFTSPSTKSITMGTDNNIVTYDYTRNRYTITIDPDGGTYTGNSPMTLYYEATADIANPTKSGYTFGGWEAPKGSFAGTTYTCGVGDTTLTATWVPNTYKYIVYHDKMNVSGSGYTTAETSSGEGTFGSTVTPDTKTYTGFTSPTKRGLQIKVDTNTPPTINTLTYQYSRNQYTLTIDTNGGTYSGTNPVTMYYGASVTLGTPIKKNYNFTGWTKTVGTDSSLSGSSFTMGSSNATVRAGWSAKTCSYTVKHMKENANDTNYTLAETEEKTGDCGSSVTPPVKSYDASQFGTTTTKTITLEEGTTPVVTYNYPRKTYTLTINPNGGSYNSSTSNTTQTLKYGQSITLSTPIKEGYSNAWSKDETDSTLSGSTFTMGTENATVTANWTVNKYTVTFNANGGTIEGSSASSMQVTYDSAYGELPMPTLAGYTFLGWFTARTGGDRVTSTTKYTATGNTTLYAHWWRSNYLMAVTSNYNEKLWAHKDSITSIVFEATTKPKAITSYTYDISDPSSSDIIAYLVPNSEDTSTYTAYIQANGKIIANRDCSYLFHNFGNLKSITGLENLDTSEVTNMASMFEGCSSLTTLDLSNFNTSGVFSMTQMFMSCSKLTTLDVSHFDTSKVTGMSGMFWGCGKLTILDISSFNTSGVWDMRAMFNGCSSLTTLDLSNFDTSRVSDMSLMFNGCSSLTILDLSNFNTCKVTDMHWMFDGCRNLTTLDVSHFDTSSVTNMNSMFASLLELKTLDLSNFDISNVTNMTNMFYGSKNLTTTITIRGTKCNSYIDMFFGTSTSSGKITVNYTADASSLVDNMIENKSPSSNVVKGTQVA